MQKIAGSNFDVAGDGTTGGRQKWQAIKTYAPKEGAQVFKTGRTA
jgi:hypothetical protein